MNNYDPLFLLRKLTELKDVSKCYISYELDSLESNKLMRHLVVVCYQNCYFSFRLAYLDVRVDEVPNTVKQMKKLMNDAIRKGTSLETIRF